MARLPGLSRSLALLMLNGKHGPTSTVTGRDVARFAIQAGTAREELESLCTMCGEWGQLVFKAAIDAFDKDPTQAAKDQMIEMLLLEAQDRREGKEEPVDGEEVESEFEAGAEAAPDMELRQHLADRWGIESAEDFEMMMEAMQIVRKENENTWLRCSRGVQNQLTKEARALYERAHSAQCPPSKLREWDALQWSENQANVIYIRPWDKVEVWGNGDLVIHDEDGNPTRAMPTVFGKDAAQSDTPMDYAMRDMVRRAFPDFYRR